MDKILCLPPKSSPGSSTICSVSLKTWSCLENLIIWKQLRI